MAVSRPCEQCHAVTRCRMHLDADSQVVYLCAGCARELEYAGGAGA